MTGCDGEELDAGLERAPRRNKFHKSPTTGFDLIFV